MDQEYIFLNILIDPLYFTQIQLVLLTHGLFEKNCLYVPKL